MDGFAKSTNTLIFSRKSYAAALRVIFGYEQNSRLAWLAATLALVLALTLNPVFAQEEREGNNGLPEILVAGIEDRIQEFPDLIKVRWAAYTDRDVSMWLPDTYEQSLIEDLLVVIDERAALLGEELAPLMRALASDPDLYRFAAFDPESYSSGVMSNVIVTRESQLFEVPALDVAKAFQSLLPEIMVPLSEPVEFELQNYDAAYAEILTTTVLNEVISLQYYVVDERYMYSVTFTATSERHKLDQAISELVMSTFSLEREKLIER